MKTSLNFFLWIACLALTGCGQPRTTAVVQPSVFVNEIHNDSGAQSQVLSASVRPRIESDLAFRAGGKVIARLVDVGQVVKAGQVLARIDANDYQLGLDAAREQVRAAEVDATQSASDAARFRRLLSDGSISAADVERQQAKADAASARLAQSKQQLALATNRVGYTTLVSPFDGVVTAIRIESGQVVAEGQPVLSVARPGELEIVADIPETLTGTLRSYAASMQIANSEEHLPLRLRELSPSASQQTRTFRARYAIDGRAARTLQIGMTAELHLSRSGQAPSALLPVSAVLSTNTQATVWIVDEKTGGLTRQPVKLIMAGTDSVRVAGLNDGALVVSAGAQKLDANMKVVPQRRPLAMAASAGELP
jgi:RND family efflux transporter MFP subunit